MALENKIRLSDELTFSRIIHGHWRLDSWGMTSKELLNFIEQLIDLGVSTFDHADIYGNYSCEKLFGDALSLKPSLKDNIQLVTKCGIKLKSEKFPDRGIKIYDYSKEHIISSVENSLSNFQTEKIDLLLFHRPAPFFNPEEVAEAIRQLKTEGKVLHFGVSNFLPLQFEMLQEYVDEKLLTNQLEISPYCLEHFDNGNIDFLLKERVHPMAWSPLAGGRFFSARDDITMTLLNTITEVAEEMNTAELESVIYSWLLMHPSGIMPVVGSGKLERVKMAIDSLTLEMNLEQWYRIFIAGKGEELA